MKEIQIKITGKIALCQKRYLISSNSNYKLTFDFDDEWNVCDVKTARVVFDGKSIDLVFTGDSVVLPKIPPCSEIAVGVFSDTLATTFAQLGCIISCADSDFEVLEQLTESQYEQIIALLNNRESKNIENINYESNILSFTFSDGNVQSFRIFNTVSDDNYTKTQINEFLQSINSRLDRLENLVGVFARSDTMFINLFNGEITQENNILKIGA